jgi:tetratricopeptide (TPR) repeat protein
MKKILKKIGESGWIVVTAGWLCAVSLFGCASATEHIQRGDELIQAQMYEEALREFEQAREIEPDNQEIAARIKDCKKELAEEENQAGVSLTKSGKRLEALAAFKRAISLDPGESKYKTHLIETADALVAEGRKHFEEKRFKEAVQIFEGVLKVLPKHPEANQAMRDAESARAELLYSEASDYLKRGLYGNALISLVKLKKMVGSYQDSADIEIYTREQILKAAIYGIKVQPGKVRRKWLEHTREIVARLQAVKLEKCPSAVMPASEDPKLTVSVILKEIAYDQSSEETTAKQKYQSGIRKVDNPEYLKIQAQIAKGRDRVSQLEASLKELETVIEQARQAFADAGPDADEASLRKRLTDAEKKQADHQKELADKEQEILGLRSQMEKTPAKLDEPVFDEYEYEISKITRTATARVKVVARGEGGGDTETEEVEGSASTEDTTNPADAKHSVKPDPLEFPKSDEALGGEAIAKTIDGIGEFIGKQCQRWNEEILLRAQQAASAAPIEAVEDYVLYLLVSSGTPPDEVLEFLKSQLGFTDVKALRGRG